MRACVSPPQPSESHIVATAPSMAHAASTAFPPFWKIIAPAVAPSGLPVIATHCLPWRGGLTVRWADGAVPITSSTTIVSGSTRRMVSSLIRGASPLGLPDTRSRAPLATARFRLRAKRYGETSPKPWRRRADCVAHSLGSFAPSMRLLLVFRGASPLGLSDTLRSRGSLATLVRSTTEMVATAYSSISISRTSSAAGRSCG